MSTAVRIALIHGVALAMEPIRAAFERDWPEARLVNILDDSLPADRAAEEVLSPAVTDRIVALARYGRSTGADAVLFTCSAFGPAIERANSEMSVPILKPNEAMFAAALGHGDRIGMLATFAPSVATLEEEFRQEARRRGRDATLETVVVPGAMDALRAGNGHEHDRLLAEHSGRLADADAVMLAQFSMAGAQQAVEAVHRAPVLSAPGAAVARLRELLVGEAV